MKKIKNIKQFVEDNRGMINSLMSSEERRNFNGDISDKIIKIIDIVMEGKTNDKNS